MKACGSKRKRGLLGRITSHVKGRAKRSKERLLGKSIEGNSNLVSMVGERGGEIFRTRSSLKFMACELEGMCIFYLLNFRIGYRKNLLNFQGWLNEFGGLRRKL